jgi:hypothetical protein
VYHASSNKRLVGRHRKVRRWATSPWYMATSMAPATMPTENRASIDALPADDTWPYLTRDLFAVPSQKHSYYEQLITFGTIYNGVERAWEGWLGKFEALLQTMYWYEARVHLETDSWGTYHYVWTSLSPIAVKSGAPGLYGVALYTPENTVGVTCRRCSIRSCAPYFPRCWRAVPRGNCCRTPHPKPCTLSAGVAVKLQRCHATAYD